MAVSLECLCAWRCVCWVEFRPYENDENGPSLSPAPEKGAGKLGSNFCFGSRPRGWEGAKVCVYSGHHATNNNTVNRPHLCLFFPPGPPHPHRATHTQHPPQSPFFVESFSYVFSLILPTTGYCCCWHWSCFSFPFFGFWSL
jgi:hypothetical protein